MNLSQLEVLVAIVDTGSLKDAAERVGLTHSAVSYSLSRLESELGVTLLERDRSGISITRIGEIVINHARKILGEAELIRQQANRERGLADGKIRFACVPQIPSRMLTGIIREFRAQYPDIEVVLFQGHETEIMEWLDNRMADVGTVVHPARYPLAAKFLESQVSVLLPVKHRLARKPKISLSDIQHETLIGTNRAITATHELEPASALSNLKLQYQVTASQTAIAMVAEGMDITVLPQLLVDDVKNDAVVFKPLYPAVMMRAFLVATLNSPVNQTFLAVAQQWTKSHGYLNSDT